MGTLFQIENVTKQFQHLWFKPTLVLDGISFRINEGEAVAIVGANGSGKSTLMQMMTGLYMPTKGTILYRGRSVSSMQHMRQEVAFTMPSGKGLYPTLTVKQALQYKAYLCGKTFREDHEYMEMLDAKNLLKKRVRSCSTGEMQRISILSSLLQEPNIFMFDEPTLGLDIHFKYIFTTLVDRLKQEGKTIILVSHHVDEIAQMNRVIAIRDHGITLDQPIENHENMKEIQNLLYTVCARGGETK